MPDYDFEDPPYASFTWWANAAGMDRETREERRLEILKWLDKSKE